MIAAALVTLAFELSGSTIFLPVRVNGSAPRWFILDSGAAWCVLDDALASALKVAPTGTRETHGAGKGGVPSRLYDGRNVRFELTGLKPFACEHVLSLDLSGQRAIVGREVGGILGHDFIAQYVVEIDYGARRLRLHGPRTFTYPGSGEVLPLTLDKRLPYVTARITVAGVPPQDRRLLIDTGSEDEVDDDMILQSKGPRREVTGGVGLGTTYAVTLGEVERLQLGNIALTGLHGVAPGVALIGGGVLKRFRVILDYSRQRMILEKP